MVRRVFLFFLLIAWWWFLSALTFRKELFPESWKPEEKDGLLFPQKKGLLLIGPSALLSPTTQPHPTNVGITLGTLSVAIVVSDGSGLL